MNRFISNLAKGDIEKAVFLKRLVSAWYFILLPFAVLIFIKVYSMTLIDVFLVSDWSIASFIIYGQLISQITVNSINLKNIADHGLEYYVNTRIAFGLTSNIVIYILMALKPNIYLGVLQMLLFIFANIRYFSDNLSIYDLKKANQNL